MKSHDVETALELLRRLNRLEALADRLPGATIEIGKLTIHSEDRGDIFLGTLISNYGLERERLSRALEDAMITIVDSEITEIKSKLIDMGVEL